MREVYTIDRIQSEMRADGSHWWDAGTLRYFGCRVGSQVYQGPGGIYFVTSEKQYDGTRGFSVRQYLPGRKTVETIDGFCGMTRAVAHRRAATLAETPIAGQFAAALDEMGMPDEDADISAVRNGSPVVLLNGSRFRAERYESGGFYLRFDDDDSDRPEYALQSELCRVLETEPAGPDSIVAAEAHHPATEADDFAATMLRETGMDRETADNLRGLSSRHHRTCERQCNGERVSTSRIESQIRKLCEPHGATPMFSGDPRGATVRIAVASGYTDDMARTGVCVPIRN